MKTIIKILFLFITLTLSTTLLIQYTDIKFGTTNFFINHGFIFLISIAFFPRLTLIISAFIFGSITAGGILWWVGLLIAPRIMVAILATISYWQTNPILVIFSWLVAIGGEGSEKVMISRRVGPRTDRTQKSFQDENVIEAEYKRTDK